MLRYLLLLRHAQSADKQTGQTDKERGLTTTGITESNRTGFFLKENLLIPDLIITSSALRAKTTATLVSKEIGYAQNKILLEDDLYETTIPHLLERIARVENNFEKLMVVGHNPVISFLINRLTENQSISLMPAECVVLKFQMHGWNGIHHIKSELINRFIPQLK